MQLNNNLLINNIKFIAVMSQLRKIKSQILVPFNNSNLAMMESQSEKAQSLSSQQEGSKSQINKGQQKGLYNSEQEVDKYFKQILSQQSALIFEKQVVQLLKSVKGCEPIKVNQIYQINTGGDYAFRMKDYVLDAENNDQMIKHLSAKYNFSSDQILNIITNYYENTQCKGQWDLLFNNIKNSDTFSQIQQSLRKNCKTREYWVKQNLFGIKYQEKDRDLPVKYVFEIKTNFFQEENEQIQQKEETEMIKNVSKQISNVFQLMEITYAAMHKFSFQEMQKQLASDIKKSVFTFNNQDYNEFRNRIKKIVSQKPINIAMVLVFNQNLTQQQFTEQFKPFHKILSTFFSRIYVKFHVIHLSSQNIITNEQKKQNQDLNKRLQKMQRKIKQLQQRERKRKREREQQREQQRKEIQQLNKKLQDMRNGIQKMKNKLKEKQSKDGNQQKDL